MPELTIAPIGWDVVGYVFGDGLAVFSSSTYELIPYVDEDGSGDVAGWSLWVDRRCRGRYPGPIDVARAAAERLILGEG